MSDDVDALTGEESMYDPIASVEDSAATAEFNKQWTDVCTELESAMPVQCFIFIRIVPLNSSRKIFGGESWHKRWCWISEKRGMFCYSSKPNEKKYSSVSLESVHSLAKMSAASAKEKKAPKETESHCWELRFRDAIFFMGTVDPSERDSWCHFIEALLQHLYDSQTQTEVSLNDITSWEKTIDGFPAKTYALEKEIAESRKEVDELQKKSEGISEQLREKENNEKETEKTIGSLRASLSQTEEKYKALETENAKLSEKLKACESREVDEKKKNEALEKERDELQKELKKGKADTAASKNDENDKLVASLRQEIEALKKNPETTQKSEEISKKEKTAPPPQEDVNTLKREIQRLKTENNEMKSKSSDAVKGKSDPKESGKERTESKNETSDTNAPDGASSATTTDKQLQAKLEKKEAEVKELAASLGAVKCSLREAQRKLKAAKTDGSTPSKAPPTVSSGLSASQEPLCEREGCKEAIRKVEMWEGKYRRFLHVLHEGGYYDAIDSLCKAGEIATRAPSSVGKKDPANTVPPSPQKHRIVSKVVVGKT